MMASSFLFPKLAPHRTTEAQWFPRPAGDNESSLDALERQEESFAVRMRNIARSQAPEPIGAAFAAVLSSPYTRQQRDDTRDSSAARTPTPRPHTPPTMSRQPQPPPAPSVIRSHRRPRRAIEEDDDIDDDDDDDDASGSDLYSRVEMEARIDSMRRQVPFFADDDDDDVLPDSFGGDDMEDADGSSIMADDSGISRTFFA